VRGRGARLNANRTATRNARNNARTNARLNGAARSARVRHALNSRGVAGALHNRRALRNPNARNRILANAALAGRHGRGWWRHRNGGYGWVGPVFWPFAYYDFYNYALWGDYDDSFWGYGYDDLYAGIFAPYGYDDLSGYLPAQASASTGQSARGQSAPVDTSNQLAQMCGEDSSEIAGLPIDQFRQAIQPNEAESADLDDLAKASAKAAQEIKAACPTRISLTAPDRLAAMQARIEAMNSAVDVVQPPLDKLYGELNDEQKARLNALGDEQRQGRAKASSTGSLARNCGAAQPGVTDWPAAAIDDAIHPTEAQRASLTALQDAAAKASDTLKASCPTGDPLTPPARLKAVGARLDTILQAVKTVRPPLDRFYAELSDEQKAQFEAIGPQRTNVADQSDDKPPRRTHYHGHGVIGLRSILRRFGI
jgi:hypothetical protein